MRGLVSGLVIVLVNRPPLFRAISLAMISFAFLCAIIFSLSCYGYMLKCSVGVWTVPHVIIIAQMFRFARKKRIFFVFFHSIALEFSTPRGRPFSMVYSNPISVSVCQFYTLPLSWPLGISFAVSLSLPYGIGGWLRISLAQPQPYGRGVTEHQM